MALQTDKGSRVPEGAVRLTQSEALEHQRTIIRDWPTESDVCFLRYGRHISALANFTSSLIITNFFKNYLRAGYRGFALTFTPSILLPSMGAYYTTDKVVTESVLLMKMDCPICHQLRFAVNQFYLGIGFPALYSYISYAGLAMITKSYPLPKIHTEAKEFWKVTFGIFKQGAIRFQTVGLLQTIVVLFLPYLQNMQLLGVMSKLRESEAANKENILV